MARAVVLAALLAGCGFDSGGLRTPDRGQAHERVGEGRLSAEAMPEDHTPLDVPREAALHVDLAGQGTTCQQGGYTLSSNQPPTAGATLTLQVTGPPRTWVMAGIATVSGAFGWTGHATHDGQDPTTWTFKKVPVPAKSGPYRFGFMADAVDDNPAVGTLLSTCLP